MGQLIKSGEMNFPPSSTIPGVDVEIPYVVLGDEAFPLLNNLMKPYPRDQSAADITKATFNYRHCRARRWVECAFGILCQIFRIFHSPIHLDLNNVDNLITTACILHNMRMDSNEFSILIDSLTLPTNNLLPLDAHDEIENNNTISSPQMIRNKLKEYFCTTGAVPWQNNMIST